jgi:hypothetical protein
MKTLLVVVMAALISVGCKKDSVDNGELPNELKPKKAAIDPAKISVPTLFEQVPMDTPYILAGLEPIPLAYMAKMKDAFGPLISKGITTWRSFKKDSPVLTAVLTELDGKWSADGLESLGFSSQPRWAIYGQDGLLPIIARLEIKDGKAVRATIERIAKNAGESLPPVQTKDGHDYWRAPGSGPTKPDLIVAIEDKQIVFAIGRPADIDAKLDFVLGLAKPKTPMSDGKPLKDLMSAHGFGPHVIGYGDTQKIVGYALAELGTQTTPECAAEIQRLAKKAPRLALGYGELSTSRTSFGMVLELSSDAIDELQKLKTEVPGLGAALADEPIFAMGGGVDVDRAIDVVQKVVGVMRTVGDTCHADDLATDARRYARDLDKPRPEFVSHLRGGVMSLQDIEFGSKKGRRGKLLPEKVEGFASIATTDGKGLYDAIVKEQPMLDRLGLKTDGSLHAIGDGMLPLDFDIFGGVGDRALVIAAGSKGKTMGNKVIDAKGSGVKAPLFAATMDYGRFLKLQQQMSPMRGFDDDLDNMQDDMNTRLAALFGRMMATLDVTDKGLTLWSSLEIK